MHNKNVITYNDFVNDVVNELKESVEIAHKAGVKDSQIVLDPGVGFAKDYEQNLLIIKHVDKLLELGYPVLLGTSRKSVIGLTLDVDTVSYTHLDVYKRQHKKMKTNSENSLEVLTELLPILEATDDYSVDGLHDTVFEYIGKKGCKNGQALWPLRTAVSGKQMTPAGAFEIMEVIGKEESISRCV